MPCIIFFVHLRRFTWRIVDRLKEYKIAHRGLGEGVHTFEFVMDGSFFDCFDATKGTKGKVNAIVSIVKSSLLMEVRMTIEGTVKAICDRCLEEMELPISGELNLYAKYGERKEMMMILLSWLKMMIIWIWVNRYMKCTCWIIRYVWFTRRESVARKWSMSWKSWQWKKRVKKLIPAGMNWGN